MAAQFGLLKLVNSLLEEGANPNTQTLYVHLPKSTAKTKSLHSGLSNKLVLPSDNAPNGNDLDSTPQHNSNYGNSGSLPDSLLLPSNGACTLDESENPFTEANDPYNPFTEEDDEDSSSAGTSRRGTGSTYAEDAGNSESFCW